MIDIANDINDNVIAKLFSLPFGDCSSFSIYFAFNIVVNEIPSICNPESL